MRRPNFVHIETALWVSRLGSYSATAKRLHTTQPGISLRIRELEQTLGIKLFERQGRRMRETPEGRVFLSRIEPMLDTLQSLMESADQRTAPKGIVRIGTGDPPLLGLGNAIAAAQRQWPDVTFEVQVGIASRLIEPLKAGDLDFVIIAGTTHTRGVAHVPLGHTRVRWMMANDRWKRHGDGSDNPTLPQLLNCGPIWLVPRQSGFHSDHVETLRRHGATLGMLNTCDNVRAMVDLVCQTGGIGLIPDVVSAPYRKQGRLKPLARPLSQIRGAYSLLHREKSMSALLQKVRDIIVEYSDFDR